MFVHFYKLINNLSYLLWIGTITIFFIINYTLLSIYFRDLIQTYVVRVFSTFSYSQLKEFLYLLYIKHLVTSLTWCCFIVFFNYLNYLFWNNFRHMEESKNSYNEFLCILYLTSPNSNLLFILSFIISLLSFYYEQSTVVGAWNTVWIRQTWPY